MKIRNDNYLSLFESWPIDMMGNIVKRDVIYLNKSIVHFDRD